MDSDTEVIEKTDKKTKETISVGKPKVVILSNDDYNSFDHVEDCLIRICKMDVTTAKRKTWEVHTKYKTVVAEGNDEYLKKIKLKLRAEGLSVTLEDAE